MLDRYCLLIAIAGFTNFASANAQGLPTPIVSPDPVLDVPDTPPGQDPFPFFDDFSWRKFIALNWPGLNGAQNRGQPDRNKSLADTGPRVWQTWKSRFEIFQPQGVAPADWNDYRGSNPCGAGFANELTTLSAFSAFSDFDQAVFNLSALGNPLVDQNKNYVRYEVRVNQKEFESIKSHGWYRAANLPTANSPVPFDTGSTEIKAAWKILSGDESAQVRGRYYIVPKAQVFDIKAKKCLEHDIALVGFHIVSKTPDRPQWIWSTFEQIDNVPGLTREPKPPAGVSFSFNDPAKPATLSPAKRPPAISPANPPVLNPAPMQIIRQQPIRNETMDTNVKYWNLPQIKGTVWENYMLVATQWPTNISPERPSNGGSPFPTTDSEVANTTMETYFQASGFTCMECHQVSNGSGRDFVMFVTLDAARPNEAAVAEAFSARLTASQGLPGLPNLPLSNDPMMKELSDFFTAAAKQN
jgi:hypothetical protein